MYFSRLDRSLSVSALCLLLASFAACDSSEITCPDGFEKSGKVCLQEDDSKATTGDRDAGKGTPPPDPSRPDDNDAGQSTSGSDAGPVTDSGSDPAPSMDGSTPDAGSSTDAGSTPDSGKTSDDAGPTKDSGTPPTTECDAQRACPSTGYSCVNNKCVSACVDTKCDANATCALVRGAPTCSCNRGYLPMGTGNSLTCTRDVGCEQLNCDENATCDTGSGQRRCTCKAGYTGDGKNCNRIVCPSLSDMRPENGRITADGPLNIGKVATLTCNDNTYKITEGSGVLVCDETGKWTGQLGKCTPITCEKPKAIEHAALTAPDKVSYRPDEKATYKCDMGFKEQSSAALSITCGRDGKWSASTLTCSATCGNGRRDDGEACDFALDPYTCSTECKQDCPGGLCKPKCPTDSNTRCPSAPSGTRNLSAKCVDGCVLDCSSAFANCPSGTMCSDAKICVVPAVTDN